MSERFGGEWGSRTPVESRETRDAGTQNDVVVPVLLALALSGGVAVVWCAWMVVVRSLGVATYWLFAVLADVGLFLSPQLGRWIWGRRYTHRHNVWVMGVGAVLSVLGAHFSVALWEFSRGIPLWKVLLPAPAVGVSVGLVLLFVSTFQESFFRSPFMEQALALLLHQEETPWYRQPENRPEPPEPPRIKVEISNGVNGAGRHLKYVNLDLTEQQVRDLARICLVDGDSFSESNVAGSGKPFGSRDDYRAARGQLVEGHFLKERVPGSPRQGWEWTRAGRELLGVFAEDFSTN